MNSYEQKREARIARMRAGAERKAAESAAKIDSVQPLLDCMNGTPLLIGHHSQRRHERDRKRIGDAIGKGVALAAEAKTLARRADAAEESTAVSSDDPDAIEKLRDRLAAEQRRHAAIIDANKLLRLGGDDDEVKAVRTLAVAWGVPPIAAVRRLDTWRSMGHKTVPTTSSAAEQRRLAKRIAELEAKASAPARAPERIGDVEIAEAENRVRLTFPGKPDEKTIAELKSHGFRWSPSVGAWQRHASTQGWFWAREIANGGV